MTFLKHLIKAYSIIGLEKPYRYLLLKTKTNLNRFTRIVFHPGEASIKELEAFSKLLDLHPYILIDQYDLALYTVSIGELTAYKEHFLKELQEA